MTNAAGVPPNGVKESCSTQAVPMVGRPTAPAMFGVGWYWKTTWFCVWILSQTQGFALPAMPSVVGEEVPPCLVWEQSQGGNNGYDAGFQSGLGYDAEFLPATTQGLNDPVGTVPTIPAYDLCRIRTIQVAGAPRAPPVAEVGFLAAKAGTRALTEAEQAIYGRVTHPKGFRQEVWERAKAPDGNVYDPTGRILKYDEPWELGHNPANKFSDAQRRAAQEGWDRQTWIPYQNDPDIYRLELPSSNAGHRWE